MTDIFIRRPLFLFALFCSVLAASGSQAQPESSEIAELERAYEQAEAEYLDALSGYLPGAYREHFSSLSDRRLQYIADTRKLWEQWTLICPKQHDFQKQFLDPIDQVGEMLIVEADSIRDSEIKTLRATAGRLAEKLDMAKKRAGVEIDPTVGTVSPTGIQFPSLDRPHTTVDRLVLMERSLILAQTVGLRESKPVLMNNAELCAQIDVEEASFTMYANKVRMLTGANAWVANPITTACARDHSIDRVAGRASGHTSTVPGKEGLGDRAQRFGTPVRSEGAGGGKSGWHYIRGLSYGGGHTGPLYRSMRNVVGPGRVDGCYTSMYYHDKQYRHDCQEYRNELFMPPGVTRSDIETDALAAAYDALQHKQFNQAYTILDEAERPEDKFQYAIQRYLMARIFAEVESTLTGVEKFAEAGDVYTAKSRFDSAKPVLEGIPQFDKVSPRIERWFGKEQVAHEIEVGQRFFNICAKGIQHGELKKLIEQEPGSAYAKAAQKCIDDKVSPKSKGHTPLLYFCDINPHLNKWSYLTDVLGG